MKPGLIDTHCHLDMDTFSGDLDEVIKRARNTGIEYIINVGSDRETNLIGLEIASKHPEVYMAVGIHPHEASQFNKDNLNELREWAKDKKVVAIGEIGLDYHYMNSPNGAQIDSFRSQLALAKELRLPVIVHSREARADTIRILREEFMGNTGVLHCFSGDRQMARDAMEMGFYISIAGPVTFKNASKLRDIVTFIPDEFLLIETDAPYLTPVPFRGKRNEPSYLLYTAKVIAELRGVALEDIARITSLNAKKLFGIGDISDEGVIAYQIRDALYLNITNRCTNRCSFCVRFRTSYVKGHNLKLRKEPSVEEIIKSIGNPKQYSEIVFCGIGEPLLRLDVVIEVSKWLKQRGVRVRINTNGHGNLIHGRNIVPDLKGLIDCFSISLDAEDAKKYEQICKPTLRNAFNGMIEFIKEAKKIADVVLTVVDVPEIDVKKCKKIAEDLGVGFRIRELNSVG